VFTPPRMLGKRLLRSRDTGPRIDADISMRPAPIGDPNRRWIAGVGHRAPYAQLGHPHDRSQEAAHGRVLQERSCRHGGRRRGEADRRRSIGMPPSPVTTEPTDRSRMPPLQFGMPMDGRPGRPSYIKILARAACRKPARPACSSEPGSRCASPRIGHAGTSGLQLPPTCVR